MASPTSPGQMTMEKTYKDIELTCDRCHSPFVWTANDQRFFDRMVAEGKWESPTTPRKCRPCKMHIKDLKIKNPV